MSVGLNYRGRKALALSLGMGAVLLLAACSKDKDLEYKEQSVYEIYSQALGYLDDGQYKDAAKYFDEVERQHPYSVWATKAKLMAAYSLYQNNKYDDAINNRYSLTGDMDSTYDRGYDEIQDNFLMQEWNVEPPRRRARRNADRIHRSGVVSTQVVQPDSEEEEPVIINSSDSELEHADDTFDD